MDAVKFLQERDRMYKSGAATPSIGLEDDYDMASKEESIYDCNDEFVLSKYCPNCGAIMDGGNSNAVD